MQLRFTKGAARHDTLEISRRGALAETVECPKQGIIPHDMVHFAVESTLQKRGFLGRVLAGETAAFTMAGESESDGVERLVEVLQADGWAGWNNQPGDLLDLYRVTCNARQCEPLAIRAEDIDAVRARILQLTVQWKETPVGKSLVLSFERDRDSS